MIRIEWSEEAISHLAQIHSYIAADSEQHAGRFILKLMRAVDNLSTFPDIGRHVPGVKDRSVREIIVPPYRVVYQVHGDAISVAAVVHSSRDLSTLPQDTP